MKVLVTGASGFLGKTLVERLLNNNVDSIYGISRSNSDIQDRRYLHINLDLNDFNAARPCIGTINPDIVFHFASNPLVKESNSELINTNVTITDKVLKSSKDSRFIFASSAMVYGLSSNKRYETSETCPESLYGVTKLQSEELVKYYTRIGYLNSSKSIRYVAHVGKNATHGVLHDIIRKVKSSEEEVEIFGSSPGTVKPYLYASQSMDETIKLSLSDWVGYSCNNLSPDDNLSIDELVDLVLEKCGKKLTKKWLGESSTWAGDQKLLRVVSRMSPFLFTSKQAVINAIEESI